MIIDTRKQLTNFKGDTLLDPAGLAWTIGRGLSEILIAYKPGGAMKTYVLATKVYAATAPIEIDSTEVALVREALKHQTAFDTSLIPGQIEVYIESLKEENK